MRTYSPIDHLLIQVDNALQTISGNSSQYRANPAQHTVASSLTPTEEKHSAGLMRVNHVGEVCAQALYRGQALSAKTTSTRDRLLQCAKEETDHLAWCETRLKQLHSRPSYLNTFWYTHAFFLGILMGLLGDAWSLGFIEETENQVEAHLENHLRQISIADTESRAIIEQMKQDEASHAKAALEWGGKQLPRWIAFWMRCQAKVMTTVAYWI